ncbi:hypothetical protein HMPREF0208_00955 [Citrobacter koseri]|nr:hypothetical protein HMPREF0208_00955 [Citrobacter koseri]
MHLTYVIEKLIYVIQKRLNHRTTFQQVLTIYSTASPKQHQFDNI